SVSISILTLGDNIWIRSNLPERHNPRLVALKVRKLSPSPFRRPSAGIPSELRRESRLQTARCYDFAKIRARMEELRREREHAMLKKRSLIHPPGRAFAGRWRVNGHWLR